MELAAFVQFFFSGLTEGSVYALAALGFTLIYNASGALNFAQGEFIMLGGLITAVAVGNAKLPLGLAMLIAVGVVLLVSMALQEVFRRTLKRSGALEVIMLTVAFGMIVRGVVQAIWGTKTFSLPPFGGAQAPMTLLGATILPQTIWIIAVAMVSLVLLAAFFNYSRVGRASIAVSHDPVISQLMGIDVRLILIIAFVLSGLLGAVSGIVTTPLTYTNYEVGVIIGLKAVIAAIIGGMGSPVGAVVGGFMIGLVEAMTAGYISSAYKDAVPFLLIAMLFLVKPSGLLGKRAVERV